jgi:hypothetical protein
MVLRTVSLFGALLVNYGKITLAKYTVVQMMTAFVADAI